MQYLLVSILVIFAIGFFAVPGAAAAGSGMSLSVDCSGSTCAISGQTDRTDQDVSIIVESSIGIQAILQTDTSGGQFSTTIGVSDYPDGTYTIKANQGSSSKYTTSVSIDVSGGSSSSSDSVSNIVGYDTEPTAVEAAVAAFLASNPVEQIDQLPEVNPVGGEYNAWGRHYYTSYLAGLYYQQHLKPFLQQVDNPLVVVDVLKEEFYAQCLNTDPYVTNPNLTQYNSDGTINEEYEIAHLDHEFNCVIWEHTVDDIPYLVNDGMSFQSALNSIDDEANEWIESYLHIATQAAEEAAAWAEADAAADAAAADAAAAAAADAAAAVMEAAVTDEIVIPDWIRINAGWWADGLIDDRAFVSGLQWLITNGIMIIG